MHLCRFEKTDLTTNLSRQITTGVHLQSADLSGVSGVKLKQLSITCGLCWQVKRTEGEQPVVISLDCSLFKDSITHVFTNGCGCNGACQSSPMTNSKAGMQVCFGIDANVLLAPQLVMNGSRWVLNIIVVVQYSGLYSCRHTCTQTLSG